MLWLVSAFTDMVKNISTAPGMLESLPDGFFEACSWWDDLEASPAWSRSELHTSSLGLNKQDSKHQGWPVSGSPLGSTASLDSNCDLESGKNLRFPKVFSRSHVEVDVLSPETALYSP